LVDVQSHVHTEASRVQHVKSDVEDVKSRVLAIQPDAHNTWSLVTDEQSHIHTINSRVQTVDSRVQHIKSDLEDVKNHVDNLAVRIVMSVASSEALKIVDENIDALLDLQRAGGTLKLSSITQNLFIDSVPSSNYILDMLLADLTNLAAGDTIQIRHYIRIKSGGNYILEDSELYNGLVNFPLVKWPREGDVGSPANYHPQPNRYGQYIEVIQTATAVAASYPTIDYEYWTYS